MYCFLDDEICRLFCGVDDTYCLFLGSLNNLCTLNKQYGLSKGSNEAMFVIEAYRTLRDRGPYPADQVVKDLDGSFAFVVYDSKAGTVFTALVCSISTFVMILFFKRLEVQTLLRTISSQSCEIVP